MGTAALSLHRARPSIVPGCGLCKALKIARSRLPSCCTAFYRVLFVSLPAEYLAWDYIRSQGAAGTHGGEAGADFCRLEGQTLRWGAQLSSSTAVLTVLPESESACSAQSLCWGSSFNWIIFFLLLFNEALKWRGLGEGDSVMWVCRGSEHVLADLGIAWKGKGFVEEGINASPSAEGGWRCSVEANSNNHIDKQQWFGGMSKVKGDVYLTKQHTNMQEACLILFFCLAWNQCRKPKLEMKPSFQCEEGSRGKRFVCCNHVQTKRKRGFL